MSERIGSEGVNYSAIEYARTKQAQQDGFRGLVEWYTIRQLLGDVTGLRVLDAGCGDGIYTRRLIDMGAERVIAVDKTEGMIDLAKNNSTGHGGKYENKVEYHLSPMEDFWGKGDCDLVLGSYLLNYAKSPEELMAYCRAVASHLKQGGYFIVFNNNPFEVYDGERYAEYGFRKVMHGGGIGAPIEYLVEGMQKPIVNYYLSPEVHEHAFVASRMVMEWVPVVLDPSQSGNRYWDNFFAGEPPFIAIQAMKI